MKKYGAFALVLVLTAMLFTGCGCTNQDMEYTSLPTTLPTAATTAPTRETTMPTTAATTEETIDRGNGPLESESTGNTESSGETSGTAEGRARSVMPRVN